jgi:hypothetical protein
MRYAYPSALILWFKFHINRVDGALLNPSFLLDVPRCRTLSEEVLAVMTWPALSTSSSSWRRHPHPRPHLPPSPPLQAGEIGRERRNQVEEAGAGRRRRGRTCWWWGGLNQQGKVPAGTSLRREAQRHWPMAIELTRRGCPREGWEEGRDGSAASTEHRRRESCSGEKSLLTGYRILYRFFLLISERLYWVRSMMNNNSVRLCSSLITAF